MGHAQSETTNASRINDERLVFSAVASDSRETTPVSTIPATQTPMESLEKKFQRLAAVWRAETAYTSSSSELVAHPAFQEIVGMGPAIIPILLRELEQRTGHWHRALRRITGIDPVPPTDQGNIAMVAEAWLRWSREQG